MLQAIIATLLAATAAAAATGAAAADQDDIPIIDIRQADGTLAARAMLYAGRGGVEVRVQAAGLRAGRYGIHLHGIGRCDGPGFDSAGPHWNPAGRRHGSLNRRGPHLGDLPNLDVDADGGGRVEFVLPGASLRGGEIPAIDADGAALVIHARPDDYRTDPSGNSGARIACGVLR